MSFLEPGIFDCELGNSVLLALSNVLRITIVIYSSISSYPLIPLIPKESPSTNVPIYVAFNQSGKGHYDALATISIKNMSADANNSEGQNQEKRKSCSCGKGGAKDKSKEFCNSYGSRCKCFQNITGCSSLCRCLNCGNPHDKRIPVQEAEPLLQRKRRKHNNIPLSSLDFLQRLKEPLVLDNLEEFEIFTLQLILHDKMDVDNDILYEVFSSILLSAGFNTIPSKDKVKALVSNLLRERELFTLTLIQELRQNFTHAYKISD